MIFILMIFGSYVRALGAGLACPDWPLCHGQLIPLYVAGDPIYLVYAEYVHRLIALSVVFLVIGIVLCAYRYKHISPRLFQISILLAILLAIQIILGGLSIDIELNEIVVTTHFAVATTIFGISIVHGMLTNYDLSVSKVQQELDTVKRYKEGTKSSNVEIH